MLASAGEHDAPGCAQKAVNVTTVLLILPPLPFNIKPAVQLLSDSGSYRASSLEGGMGILNGIIGNLLEEAAPAGRLFLEECSGGQLELWSLSAEKSQQTKGKSHTRDLLDLKVPTAVRAAFSVLVEI